MVTQAMVDLARTARSRLRYANHKRMLCETKVPTTNTKIVFGTWIIAHLASYDIVGMLDSEDTIVVTNSTTTADAANLLLHVWCPYSAKTNHSVKMGDIRSPEDTHFGGVRQYQNQA